jgi:hypothetical protein
MGGTVAQNQDERAVRHGHDGRIRKAGFWHPGESFLHYPVRIAAARCLSSTRHPD